MPTFDQIGVEFVVAGIGQAQRDANTANRILSDLATGIGGVGNVQAAAGAAALQSAQAEQAVAVAMERAAAASVVEDTAIRRLQEALVAEWQASMQSAAGNVASAAAFGNAADRARVLAAQAIQTAAAYDREAEAAMRAAEAQTVRAGIAGEAAGAAQNAALMQGVATAGLAAAAGIAAAGAAAVKFGADYQSAMTIVQSTTKATDDQVKDLTAVNQTLAASFGVSEVQAARFEITMARSGISIQQMASGGAAAVAQLARATGTDLNTAAVLVSNSLNGFSASGVTAAQVARDLSNGINASAMTAQGFGTAIATAANQAIALKIPYDQLIAVIALLGSTGATSSRDINTLSQTLSAIINPSSQARTNLQDFDAVLIRAKDGSLDLIGTLQNLNNTYGQGAVDLGKLTRDEADHNAKLISGAQSARDMAIAFSNVANNGPAMLKTIQDSAAAMKVAEDNTRSLGGELGKTMASFGNLAATVGGPAANAMASWLHVVNQTTAAQQEYNRWLAEVHKEMQATGESFVDAQKKIGTFTEWQQKASDAARDQAAAEKEAAEAAAAESAAAVEAAKSNEALAGSAKTAAAAERELAAAAREAASAEGRAEEQRAGAIATGITEGARGTSVDRVQQARNSAAAEIEAAKFKAAGVESAARTEAAALVDSASSVAIANYNASQKTTADWNKAMSDVQAAVTKSNALQAEAATKGQTIQSDAAVKAAADVRVALDNAARAGGNAYAGVERAAQGAADKQTTSADLAFARFDAAMTKMRAKAEDDFAKMANKYNETIADIHYRAATAIQDETNRVNEQIANIIERTQQTIRDEEERTAQSIANSEAQAAQQINDIEAALAQSRSDRARRTALEEQQATERKTLDAQIRQQQDALNDQISKEQLAYDLQKALKEKGADDASIAADKQARLQIEASQLATATTQAQRDQIIANYDTNEKVAAMQVQSTIDAVNKQQSVREDDAAFQDKVATERQTLQDKLDQERLTQQKKFDDERQALDDKFADETAARQIAKIHETLARQESDQRAALARQEGDARASQDRQIADIHKALDRRKDEINQQMNFEVARAARAYADDLKNRQDSLNEQLAARTAEFDLEMVALDAHLKDQYTALVRQDSAISAEATKLANDQIIKVNAVGQAAHDAAAQLASALHLPGPPPFTPAPTISGTPYTSAPAPTLPVGTAAGSVAPAVTTNNNNNAQTFNLQANYATTQSPVELQHDVNAIMALARGR